jgi:NADH:ubiquinone oxidoreductase subunit 5 (subunit L)/multisubunit Na+/H+ antiporter MnhA subunit
MSPASDPNATVPHYTRAIVALPVALFAWLCTMIPAVSRGETLHWGIAWLPQRGIEFGFFVDGLSLLFALLITGIGGFIFLYASEYMRGYPQVGRFTTFLVGFMLSMLGLVLSDNLIGLFIFWELTTITSFLLIGYSHEESKARRAALQGLIVTGAGALAMLAGFVILGDAAETYSLREMLDEPGALVDHPDYLAIVILIFAGAFTKSAQFPFHFWLPNAMEAPTPVSAYLHSATMVKAGVFLLARTSPILGGTAVWTETLTIVGALTAVYSAAVALTKNDLKQVLAYTTVMALGVCMMFLGLPVESGEPPASLIAAVTFVVVHALYKAALFMVAGTIDHSTGTRDIRWMGGLRQAMPWTFAAAVLAALSMAGVPPFLGFVGKELLYSSVLASSAAYYATAAIFAANALVVTAALLVGSSPFAGPLSNTPRNAHEGSWTLWIGSLALGCCALLAGLVPGPLFEYLLVPASASVTGSWPHYEAGLWHGFGLPLVLSVFTLAAGCWLYWKRSASLAGLRRILARAGERRSIVRRSHGRHRRFFDQADPLDAVRNPAPLSPDCLRHARVGPGRDDLAQGRSGLAVRASEGHVRRVGARRAHRRLRHRDNPGQVPPSGDLRPRGGRGRYRPDLPFVRSARCRDGAVHGRNAHRSDRRDGAPQIARFQGRSAPEWTRATARRLGLVLGRRHNCLGSACRNGGTAADGAHRLLREDIGAGGVRPERRQRDSRRLPGARHARRDHGPRYSERRGIHACRAPPAPKGAEQPRQRTSLRTGADPFRQDRGDTAMNTLIMRETTRLLVALILMFSVFMLLRGHDQPGGGFVGGLIASIAFCLYLFVADAAAVRRLLRADPSTVGAVGLGMAIASGLVGFVVEGAPFLTCEWTTVGGFKVGTPLAFDVGVYLVVVGAVLTFVLGIKEQLPVLMSDGTQ